MNLQLSGKTVISKSKLFSNMLDKILIFQKQNMFCNETFIDLVCNFYFDQVEKVDSGVIRCNLKLPVEMLF